jgi:myo-inositol-1(or 4)-monophosphatase
MHPLVNIGVRAARQAGKIILQAIDHLDKITVEEKGVNDYVTQIDKAAEQEIIHLIRKAYPEHSILAEESGLLAADHSEITWIIDPLDGTTNFIHGYPQFCVSIGMMLNQRLEHGIIFDPLRGELFTASRGRGAQLNERRIRVSTTTQLKYALLGTGFPSRDPQVMNNYFQLMQALFPISSGVRRGGSAALDLAYIACGRLDGFWEYSLKPWDIAAGALLIQEAGGFVSSFRNTDDYLESGNVVAGTPKIHKALLEILAQHQA